MTMPQGNACENSSNFHAQSVNSARYYLLLECIVKQYAITTYLVTPHPFLMPSKAS